MNKLLYTAGLLSILGITHLLINSEAASPAGDRVYFESTVRPVFANKCSICHSQMTGRNWEEYETAVRNKANIKLRAFIRSDMPPNGLPQLDKSQADVLLLWLEQ